MARNFLSISILSEMLFRGSGRKIFISTICLIAAACLQAPVALAQHGGGHGGFGGGHVGGGHVGGWHSSAPRASHSAKGGSGPRGSAFGARGPVIAARPVTSNSSSFRLHPIPRPTPTPQPIFFVPVYFGAPFFLGGFNSWCACGPFWAAGCFYSPFYGYGYGFGGYYGGFSSGWGGYAGLSAGSNVYYSSNASEQGTTPAQSYVYPSERRDLVELFFKDGTVYDVTDYWVVEGEIHFLTVDESGQKTIEHVLPFDTLDLQTTVDDNTSRGFKFQLRNESMEQYFRDHPDSVPKGVDPNAPQN